MLVTGTSSGIGLHAAITAACAGHPVIATMRNHEGARALGDAAAVAVEGFMESLAPVAARAGMTVTVVEPGAVASSFVASVGGDLSRTGPANDPYAGALDAYLARTKAA